MGVAVHSDVVAAGVAPEVFPAAVRLGAFPVVIHLEVSPAAIRPEVFQAVTHPGALPVVISLGVSRVATVEGAEVVDPLR